MTHGYVIAAGATFALVGLLLVGEVRGPAWLRWTSKPLASLGFLGAALGSGVPGARWEQVLLGALAWSLVGDVLLLSHASWAFLAGLGAFLLAHVLFAVAFVLRGTSAVHAGVAAGAVVVGAVVVWRWLRPHLPDRMATPVLAYIAAISAMVCLAVGTAGVGAGAGRALLGVGAVGFFVSDLAVARDRFVSPGVSNRLWGLPLYYGAQLLFAAAVALPF
jgi:Predicted membrane protein